MKFKNLYIVGSGSICISILKSLIKDGYNPVMILYKEHNISMLGNFVKNNNIENYSFDNKAEITIFLEKVREKALIISANNVYLFPSIIVDKENLKIINFHNALLPRHRGMNAPTWTIYEMDKKAGITWHLVNKNIDDGEIIIQKEINLNGTETAIYLIKQLMNLAFVAFEEIKYDLLDWNLKTYPMRNDIQYQIHYSKDIPNNGIYNESWNFQQKSAFLRSLDWGCIPQFPQPIIKTSNGDLIIENYKINENKIEICTRPIL